MSNSPIPNFKEAKLIYIGTNWDGQRHCDVFEKLAQNNDILFYGPEDAWRDYPESYKGTLPFDQESVLTAYNQAGIGLCVEHPDFASEGIPTN